MKGYRLIEAFKDFTLYYDATNKNLVFWTDCGFERVIEIEKLFDSLRTEKTAQ